MKTITGDKPSVASGLVAVLLASATDYRYKCDSMRVIAEDDHRGH